MSDNKRVLVENSNSKLCIYGRTGLTILSTLFWSKIEDKSNLSIMISLWYKYLMFEKYDIFIQANPFKGKSFNTPIDI